MNKFWEQSDEVYNYKILVYPNITYQKALEKDSFIVVLANVIRVMNKIRPDIHWTVLVPYTTPSLRLPNVEQRILPLPTYPNAMRTHFNVDDIKKLINWQEEDFDIVYTHLPEHTLQLKNFFWNLTNMRPKFVGYCHWFEVKENTNYEKTMFLANIAGMLEMEECGVNTQWLKDLVIERAAKYYSKEVLAELERIIQPHYLGVDSVDIPNEEPKEKIILFNHRDNGYTGWSWFIKSMGDLYKERQDFRVYTTLIDIPKEYREFATRIKLDSRKDYLEFLKQVYIGVGCFETYSAWSISTTDGLSRGAPYVLPKSLCYPEMVGNDYPLLYESKEEFIDKIRHILDHPEQRQSIKEEWVKPIADGLGWTPRVLKWFDGWDSVFELDGGKETETYDIIKGHIQSRGSVTKRQLIQLLGWGKTFSLQKYRNLLRDDPEVELTLWGYVLKQSS